MFFQIMHSDDTRMYANAGQPRFLGQELRTTSFFGPGQALSLQSPLLVPQVSCDQRLHVRREVAESLGRSLVEHRDVWADLANR